MRRNLRLDWRALALLGALLSIIIDWPGLVYAMPTILPPMTALTEQAEASSIDLSNNIKNYKTVSFLNDQAQAETVRPTSIKQNIEMKLTQHQQSQEPQEILQRITTINEKLNKQVNENHNSIRKQQQIHHKTHDQQANYEQESKLKTAIHIEEKDEEENSSARPLAAAKYQLESLPKVTSSILENTHQKNSTNNKFKSTNTNTNSIPNLSTATTATPPITPTTTPRSTPLTTTESLAKIPSTLMPTTLMESEAQAQPQKHHHREQQEHFETLFKFSSSHHLAILSRTERSIRSSSLSSLSPSALAAMLKSSNVNSSSSSSSSRISSSRGSGIGGLVRRSSDMSVLKSKRLNNSRNLQQKNNLDRNERSTVSHLSGPSRKIQLYIKNRFIQLLPDGTVNGTQDEQCDYSKYNKKKIVFLN